MHPFWPPSYTSKSLNWIEGSWEHLKDTSFRRMLTQESETLYPDAVRLLERLRRSGRLSLLAPRLDP